VTTDSIDTIADGAAGRHPIPAVLDDPARLACRHVVTVVCGGDVDLNAYRSWAHT
jgi:hypothetical protein